jgi:hypothetical protein
MTVVRQLEILKRIGSAKKFVKQLVIMMQTAMPTKLVIFHARYSRRIIGKVMEYQLMRVIPMTGILSSVLELSVFHTEENKPRPFLEEPARLGMQSLHMQSMPVSPMQLLWPHMVLKAITAVIHYHQLQVQSSATLQIH